MVRILLMSCLLFATNILALESWQPLKETVLKADLAKNRREQLQLAKKAIQLANACVQRTPQEVACYYYRGQASGLYYEVVVLGYQKGVRLMIADWQKALELDPTFDHGGPYRMLGELFATLPKFFGTRDLRQDLNKSQEYLQKAIEIDSNYPINHLDLAEALLKAKKFDDANNSFQTAQSLIPEWNQDPYFVSWQELSKDLEKKLKGVIYGKRE